MRGQSTTSRLTPYFHTSTGDDHVPGDGYVTNIHFSLTGVTGTPPEEVCDFVYAKEWDFKVCNLEGTLPNYIGSGGCLPRLEEWDFSRNHMYGPIPENAGTIERLVRFKMQGNKLTGTMPENFGDLKALEWIRIFDNQLEGTFPESYKKINPRMTQLAIGGNNFEGKRADEGACLVGIWLIFDVNIVLRRGCVGHEALPTHFGAQLCVQVPPLSSSTCPPKQPSPPPDPFPQQQQQATCTCFPRWRCKTATSPSCPRCAA